MPDIPPSLLGCSKFLRGIYDQHVRPCYRDGKHNILSSIDTILWFITKAAAKAVSHEGGGVVWPPQLGGASCHRVVRVGTAPLIPTSDALLLFKLLSFASLSSISLDEMLHLLILLLIAWYECTTSTLLFLSECTAPL